MKYTASLDKTAKVLTIVALVVILGIGTGEIILNSTRQMGVLISIGIAPLLISLLCYLYAPKSYTLHEDSLVINKVLGRVCIELTDIKEVEKIPEFEGGTIRTFGSGGFFGYYGKFYNRVIGKMNMYVTRRDTMILVKTKDERNIMISPDDIGLFDKLSVAIHKS